MNHTFLNWALIVVWSCVYIKFDYLYHLWIDENIVKTQAQLAQAQLDLQKEQETLNTKIIKLDINSYTTLNSSLDVDMDVCWLIDSDWISLIIWIISNIFS